MSVSVNGELAAVFRAMEETELGQEQAKFPTISREFVRRFWDVEWSHAGYDEHLAMFCTSLEVQRLTRILSFPGREAGQFDDKLNEWVSQYGHGITR